MFGAEVETAQEAGQTAICAQDIGAGSRLRTLLVSSFTDTRSERLRRKTHARPIFTPSKDTRTRC
jgi:hypothetical protein